MTADYERVAACAYLAALYELLGELNCHEYAEHDGRWYLDVTILQPEGFFLPFTFMKDEFGGRVLRLQTREGQNYMAWRAIGPRAYDVLTSIRPYIIDNTEFGVAIDDAVEAFRGASEGEAL